MDVTSLLSVFGLLALAVAVVIVLLRLMRARHAVPERPASEKAKDEAPTPHAPLSKEEQDYLDSSHIGGPVVPNSRDALDTWRASKRK